MRSFQIPALVVLVGCAPHGRQVQGFLDAGWYGEACAEAMESGDVSLQDRVDEATVRALAPRVEVHVAGAEAFGGRLPEGYGEEWLLVASVLQVDGEVASQVRHSLSVTRSDGVMLAPCPQTECDAAWLQARLPPVEAVGRYQEAPQVGEHTRGRTTTGRGILADLGRAVGAMGLVVTLPLALGMDVALAPVFLISGERGPSFTVMALEGLERLGSPGGGYGSAAEASEGTRCEQGACIDGWVLRASGHGEPPDTARITLGWDHLPRCGGRQHALVVPLADGPDLAARVQAALDGRERLAP